VHIQDYLYKRLDI